MSGSYGAISRQLVGDVILKSGPPKSPSDIRKCIRTLPEVYAKPLMGKRHYGHGVLHIRVCLGTLVHPLDPTAISSDHGIYQVQ